MNKWLKQISDNLINQKRGFDFIPNWLKLNTKNRHFFYALTLLYSIYALPIILADRYYRDDLTRSLRGVTGWNNDARPLTEWIMKWLCGGFPTGDISPLPLLLSILLLSYVLTLYCKRNLSEPNTICSFLYVGFAVIANPFMLSILSYKYDCVTMVIALCTAFIPYLLPDRLALWKVFAFSGVMCMITLLTYQPCCGVYICLCMLELMFMMLSASVDLPRLIMRACALCASALFYYFIILKHYIPDSGWQPQAYRFALGGDISPLSAILENYNSFTSLIRDYTAGIPSILLVLSVLLVIGGMLAVITVLPRENSGRKFFQVLYILFLPVLVLIGSLLPLLVLKPTVYSVSFHSLMALCGLGTWVGIMIYFLSRKMKRLTLLLSIPCILFCFTFSYTYGNTLKSQKQYEEYMTYNIVHDIETINADGQYHYLTVEGSMPRSKETARLCNKYPLYRQLVPVYITNSSYMGGAQLSRYMQEELEFADFTEADMDLIATGNPIMNNAIYSCYVNEDKIIIHFKNQKLSSDEEEDYAV